MVGVLERECRLVGGGSCLGAPCLGGFTDACRPVLPMGLSLLPGSKVSSVSVVGSYLAFYFNSTNI